VLLDAPRSVLEERIRKRHHEYMNPSLLDSQLATLEVAEDTWSISVSGTAQQALKDLIRLLKGSAE
jgi:gluconokinase